MTWRSLLIRDGGKLSLQRQQILIQQNSKNYTVPLEDIAVIVIESPETLITVPLLSALAKNGITLLTCDEQFLPCGQWLPYSQYHRQQPRQTLLVAAHRRQRRQVARRMRLTGKQPADQRHQRRPFQPAKHRRMQQ